MKLAVAFSLLTATLPLGAQTIVLEAENGTLIGTSVASSV